MASDMTDGDWDARLGTTRRKFVVGAGGAILGSTALAHDPSENLAAITQELVNALAPGQSALWEHWTHPHFVLTDENSQRMERKQFLSGIAPLPVGASGTIKVVDFIAKSERDTQVTTYILDEFEHYHGEELHAQYRQTDTWVRNGGAWRLLASQVIAIRTDPPAVELPPKLWQQYAGHYRLPDGLSLDISWDGNEARIRKGSGGQRPLKAELVDLLFVPRDPRIRYLVKRDGAGTITKLLQRRESWDIVWERAS